MSRCCASEHPIVTENCWTREEKWMGCLLVVGTIKEDKTAFEFLSSSREGREATEIKKIF